MLEFQLPPSSELARVQRLPLVFALTAATYAFAQEAAGIPPEVLSSA